MEDVHVGQVLKWRPVYAGIVVLRAVEAEQDVLERLARLVGRHRLGEALPVFGINTLNVSPVGQ
ncbi:hypothetical protein D3C77_730350 [compost metagenome]